MSSQYVSLPEGSGVTSINGEIGAITIAAGTGIAVVNAGNTITISATGGTGTVTSVGLSTPGVLYSVSGSPVTTAGTLALNLIPQAANTVLAGPTSGSTANPSFRLLVSADVPNNAANTTGTASNVTAGSFTQGSVIFANGAGQLAQDNINFFWDDTNIALGIGTIPATTAVLDIVNNSGTTKAIQTTGYGSNVGFRGRRANGTLASPVASLSGDVLSFFSGRGYGATGFAATSTGAISITALENFTDTAMGTSIVLSTTNAGSITSLPLFTFFNTGTRANLTFGNNFNAFLTAGSEWRTENKSSFSAALQSPVTEVRLIWTAVSPQR